ncbi:MAG: L-threonylcarbamoyladenylate synthase [Gammaproteobacteria bacterium]|nr:L-threonylcarbamoyladenylate synthase [Gammaproteobacteria bacterium]
MRERKDHGESQPGADARIGKGVHVLRGGGVIAYPNESVYGLGCLPRDEKAVERLLRLKGRDRSLGLILIAGEWEQFESWVAGLSTAADLAKLRESGGITWVMPASPNTPAWITGGRDTVAVRVSLHHLAAALSRALDSPVVSTSCNPHGMPPARTPQEARRYFAGEVDWIMPGECGPLEGPTEIRDAATGAVLRPA